LPTHQVPFLGAPYYFSSDPMNMKLKNPSFAISTLTGEEKTLAQNE